MYQAYPGNSNGTNVSFAGYLGFIMDDNTTSVPGVLRIIPQDADESPWENLCSARRDGDERHPGEGGAIVQPVSDHFPRQDGDTGGYSQHSSLVALMYEPPDTTWTLIILYGTYAPWDDDGAGPNPAGYVHQEIWRWRVTASQASMQNLLALFHELPFGTDEVPLVSDEALYASLRQMLAAGRYADFADAVGSACISVSPINPDPTGAGTGIASTSETPACCKLLIDALYVRTHL